MVKTCCCTGHREIPADKIEYVRRELRREIEQAVKDGFTYFLSGFADGVDLEFAAIVAEIKKDNTSLFLEAIIPYAGRLKTKNSLFLYLIDRCNSVKVLSKNYSDDCYKIRNAYLTEHAERVIAVFNGSSRSGTAQTIRMATARARDLRVIDISGKTEQ